MADVGTIGKRASQLLPNDVICIPTSLETDFFKKWCEYRKPLTGLTSREMEVIASFLKQRWLLSKKVQDPVILDTMLMSNTCKQAVMEECKITMKHLYVILNNLKKAGILVNNAFIPRMIPNIREDDNGCFKLMILFVDNNADKAKAS